MKLQRKERSTLPEELLQETFLKVSSVESLIRLSCVCKAWRDLITNNPYFGKAHFKSWINDETRPYYVSEKCLPGNLKKYEVKAENLSKTLNSPAHPPLLPFASQPLRLPYYTSVLGSCNGILCLLREKVIHLYNPAIQEHHILPTGLLDLEDDENYSTQHVGFGFDHEFKVVWFCFNKRVWNRQAKYVEIYRHGMNCWTLLEDDNMPLQDHDIYGDGVYVNGSFHWLVGIESNLWMNKILTFDFGAEKFGEMECVDSVGFCRCLSVLDDSLALICSKLEGWEVMDIWVMKDSWTKKFYIEIPGGFIIPPAFINCWVHDANRLELLGDDGLLLTCLLDEEEGKKCRAVTRTRILHDSRVVCGIAFRPTLLSLRGRGRGIAGKSKTRRKKT